MWALFGIEYVLTELDELPDGCDASTGASRLESIRRTLRFQIISAFMSSYNIELTYVQAALKTSAF